MPVVRARIQQQVRHGESTEGQDLRRPVASGRVHWRPGPDRGLLRALGPGHAHAVASCRQRRLRHHSHGAARRPGQQVGRQVPEQLPGKRRQTRGLRGLESGFECMQVSYPFRGGVPRERAGDKCDSRLTHEAIDRYASLCNPVLGK